jgi:hypothetical protein
MSELYSIVDSAIDQAFVNDRYVLNLYEYFRINEAKRNDATEFINSQTASSVSELIEELTEYLAGGNQQLIEAYKHVSKPKARKIRDYLDNILMDAKRYEDDRKPGRKKGSKNKKRKQTATK